MRVALKAIDSQAKSIKHGEFIALIRLFYCLLVCLFPWLPVCCLFGLAWAFQWCSCRAVVCLSVCLQIKLLSFTCESVLTAWDRLHLIRVLDRRLSLIIILGLLLPLALGGSGSLVLLVLMLWHGQTSYLHLPSCHRQSGPSGRHPSGEPTVPPASWRWTCRWTRPSGTCDWLVGVVHWLLTDWLVWFIDCWLIGVFGSLFVLFHCLLSDWLVWFIIDWVVRLVHCCLLDWLLWLIVCWLIGWFGWWFVDWLVGLVHWLLIDWLV